MRINFNFGRKKIGKKGYIRRMTQSANEEIFRAHRIGGDDEKSEGY